MNFDFESDRTILGHVFTHAGEEELALTELDRMNQMLVIGKTGTGKTRTLKNIIVQDIHTGRGVGVIERCVSGQPAWPSPALGLMPTFPPGSSVQLTLPFSVASKSGALSALRCRHRIGSDKGGSAQYTRTRGEPGPVEMLHP